MRKLPLRTLSGGRLSEFGGKKAAIAYRVWAHPLAGGDDVCFEWVVAEDARHGMDSYESALVGQKVISDPISQSIEGRYFVKVEPVIAVVYDKKFRRYREVVIDLISN